MKNKTLLIVWGLMIVAVLIAACASEPPKPTEVPYPTKQITYMIPFDPGGQSDREARRQQQINEAEGQAQAILAIAQATAEGIRRVAQAINEPGGFEAVQLRVAEQYIAEFGRIAKTSSTVVVPSNLSDVASILSVAMNVIRHTSGEAPPPPPPAQPRRPQPTPPPPPPAQF